MDQTSKPQVAMLLQAEVDESLPAVSGNLSLGTALLSPLRDRRFTSSMLIVMLLCFAGSAAIAEMPYKLARVPFLLVYFCISGYLLTYLCGIIRNGDYALPPWRGFQALLQNGIASYLIQAVFLLPAAALNYLTGNVVWNAILRPLQQSMNMADMLAPVSGSFLLLVLALEIVTIFICLFFVPAAQALYADSGRLGQSLHIPKVVAFVGGRLKGYVLYIAALLASFLVAGQLGGMVVWLLGSYGSFYSMRLLIAKTLCNVLMFAASLTATAALGWFYRRNPRS